MREAQAVICYFGFGATILESKARPEDLPDHNIRQGMQEWRLGRVKENPRTTEQRQVLAWMAQRIAEINDRTEGGTIIGVCDN
jgi:hypothetical protein